MSCSQAAATRSSDRARVLAPTGPPSHRPDMPLTTRQRDSQPRLRKIRRTGDAASLQGAIAPLINLAGWTLEEQDGAVRVHAMMTVGRNHRIRSPNEVKSSWFVHTYIHIASDIKLSAVLCLNLVKGFTQGHRKIEVVTFVTPQGGKYNARFKGYFCSPLREWNISYKDNRSRLIG